MEQQVRRRGALVNVLHYPRIIEDGEGRQWAFRVMGGSKSTSPPKWGIAYVSEEGRTGYRSTPDRPDLDAFSDDDLIAIVSSWSDGRNKSNPSIPPSDREIP